MNGSEARQPQAARTWLTEGRMKLGMDRQEFAAMCGCSEMLIGWLEDGTTITHPLIAAVIVRAIGGTVAQYNEIVHQDRRAKAVPKVKMPKRPDPWRKPRECPECSKIFAPGNKTQIYCGLRCAGKANRRQIQRRETMERKADMTK